MSTLRTKLARAIATAGGAGYSPFAPGTCGTLVAVPLAWALAPLSTWIYFTVFVAVTAVGIWAAGEADRSWNTHDSGRIVIDEVAGYLVTVLWIDRTDVSLLLIGFVVFRVLDILKPFPVREIDRKVGGGSGVVLDDVAAGIMGCAVMAGLAWLDVVPRLAL